jgi:hypothetical protein
VASRKAAEHAVAAIRSYLESKLQLQITPDKSAAARASTRDFLGYGLIGGERTRLKAAVASILRLLGYVKDVLRRTRGRSIAATIEALRGWTNYFRWAEVKNVWQELNGWMRRKLCGRVWRQCKRPWTRARRLMKRGLSEEHAWRSATNGHGAWWNAGASHMNAAFAKSYFGHVGLVSLVDTHRRFQIQA